MGIFNQNNYVMLCFLYFNWAEMAICPCCVFVLDIFCSVFSQLYLQFTMTLIEYSCILYCNFYQCAIMTHFYLSLAVLSHSLRYRKENTVSCSQPHVLPPCSVFVEKEHIWSRRKRRGELVFFEHKNTN